jgi:hypothetical protein
MVFKSLRFLGPADAVLAQEVEARWTRALAPGRSPRRPERVALNVPISGQGFPPAEFAAVDVQWFASKDAALASEEWLSSVDRDLCLGSALLGPSSCRVVAEELTFWGEQYLETRWWSGGERFKSISYANRNPSLSFTEFLPQWRAFAGIHGDERPPERARGVAYSQDHPVPLDGSRWAFDAVNEVYFATIDDLAFRRDYFAGTGEDAMQRAPGIWSPTERWTMFVRERPIEPPNG